MVANWHLYLQSAEKKTIANNNDIHGERMHRLAWSNCSRTGYIHDAPLCSIERDGLNESSQPTDEDYYSLLVGGFALQLPFRANPTVTWPINGNEKRSLHRVEKWKITGGGQLAWAISNGRIIHGTRLMDMTNGRMMDDIGFCTFFVLWSRMEPRFFFDALHDGRRWRPPLHQNLDMVIPFHRLEGGHIVHFMKRVLYTADDSIVKKSPFLSIIW